jgi:tungstate ABC transporter binding protein WtpA
MNTKRCILIGMVLILSACQAATPAPTPLPSPTATPVPTPVTILADDALAPLLAALETQVEQAHPDIDLVVETRGGIEALRQARQNASVDLLFVSDPTLIGQMEQAGLANWRVTFASDRLALAYNRSSLYQERITSSNWPRLLALPEVRLGLPDPQSDPAGYRAVWALYLSDTYYRERSLFSDFTAARLQAPLEISLIEGGTLFTFQLPLAPKEGAGLVVASTAAQLLERLSAGELDYVFAYQSQARQLKLNVLDLPRQLNFGEALQAGVYRTVSAGLDDFTPITGEAIGYAFTIPTAAPHTPAAQTVAAYLLGHEGRRLIQFYNLQILPRPLCEGKEHMPAELLGECAP